MLNNNNKLDSVIAYGHSNVLCTHRTTLEITTEDFLTKNGNCILAINGLKGVANLSLKLKKSIQNGNKIKVILRAGPYQDEFNGWGHPDLSLTNPVSMVFRTSEYISDRTVLIRCNKGSSDLNRELINYLQNPRHQITADFYLAE